MGEPSRNEKERPLIVITGAQGFAGRICAAVLTNAGFRLSQPVRTASGADPQEVAVGDLALASPHRLAELMTGAAAVVHLAGKVEAASQSDLDRANAGATAVIAEALALAGVPRFIHLSSLALFTPRLTGGVISDSTALSPESGYGRSKWRAEEIALAASGPGRLVVALRPPILIGAGAGGKWGSLMRLAASGLPLPFDSLRATRSYLSASSLADAIALLCQHAPEPARSGAYALAAADQLALPEVVAALRAGMGMPNRLWSCPQAVFAAASALPVIGRPVRTLIEPLHVDASRFCTTFGWDNTKVLAAEIAGIGAEWRVRQNGEGQDRT